MRRAQVSISITGNHGVISTLFCHCYLFPLYLLRDLIIASVALLALFDMSGYVLLPAVMY